jgi:RpiR family carbohydrate utilization transcriptional regulator
MINYEVCNMGQLLTELADSGAKRSKAAHKIASYVVSNPAAVINMPIAAVAAEIGCSEPTVNRFCTGLGLKGFPDFKLRLAQELARREFHVAQDIDAQDSCSGVVAKVFESAHASLQTTLEGLDPAAIDAVVARLHDARTIVICGQGASSSVAQDAQHKMSRFEVPVLAHQDNLMQRMSAAGLSERDCLLCISYTGRTIPLIEIAELGRESGASLIGITAPASPLAQLCDLVLPVVSTEDTDLYIPMTSRIAQLAVIDVITTRLAMVQDENYPQRFRHIKQSQLTTRLNRRG